MDGITSQPDTWPRPEWLDAVVAAPGSHRVVFENQQTHAPEVMISPSERAPTHTQRWPSIMLVDRSARIRYSVENIHERLCGASRIEFKQERRAAGDDVAGRPLAVAVAIRGI